MSYDHRHSDRPVACGLGQRLPRPARLVGVLGTNTEVGKTWVSARILSMLRSRGLRVAARKPVQSFEPGADDTDAALLAAASSESANDVCPAHRCYPIPLAPPMAADVLGRKAILMDELLEEIRWPPDVDVGLVETVGGARSPLAHDGDSIDLLRRLEVDEILLVADAVLGSLNSIRLTLECIGALPTTIVLNRYDQTIELHRLNRRWLEKKCSASVLVDWREFA
ncbi:MAG TPA: dethiobiotin synthase [Steroidobacter sp.]|nr:dethiobiotin synthase [Steroidobacter sp.]